MATATKSTHRALKNMIAVASDDKQAKKLGRVVWYSVPDKDVSARRCRTKWGGAGLEMKLRSLPKEPKLADVFQRSVSEQKGRHKLNDGSLVETTVGLVDEDGDEILYQVTRIARDKDERRLLYQAGVRVYFNKEKQEWSGKPMTDVQDSVPRRQAMEILASIEEAMERNLNTVTGSKIRMLVRDYLQDTTEEKRGVFGLSGTNLRGKAGGVYFVPEKYLDQVEGLSEFLSELYDEPGVGFLYSLPMADSRTEREILREQLELEAIPDIEKATGTVRHLLRQDRDRAVRDDVKDHWQAELAKLRRRAAEYANVLGEEQENITDHIAVLEKQIKLLGA
jgi:hypothetical protein